MQLQLRKFCRSRSAELTFGGAAMPTTTSLHTFLPHAAFSLPLSLSCSAFLRPSLVVHPHPPTQALQVPTLCLHQQILQRQIPGIGKYSINSERISLFSSSVCLEITYCYIDAVKLPYLNTPSATKEDRLIRLRVRGVRVTIV